MSAQSPVNNHADFILPGLASRSGGIRAWGLAAAFSYSSRWNRRRLEWHFYSLWAMVMSDLVADFSPHALVVPQFGFDSMPKLQGKKQSSEKDEEQTSEEDEKQSSEEDEEEQIERSVTNFERISASIADASFETISVKDARKLIPDFSILLLQHHLRDWYTADLATITQYNMDFDDYTAPVNALRSFEDWNAIEVQGVKVPCIVEVKPPVSRRLSSQEQFTKLFRTALVQTRDQLEEQSILVFTTHTTTDTLFLIAAVGEWWCWRIATRAAFEESRNAQNSDTMNILPPSPVRKPREDTANRRSERYKDATFRVDYNEKSDSDEDMTDGDQVEYNAPRFKGKRSKVKRSKGKQAIRYLSLPHMAQVEERIEDVHPTWRDTEWSKYIRLGTPASNQHFFLIHEAIREEFDSLIAGSTANSPNNNDHSD